MPVTRFETEVTADGRRYTYYCKPMPDEQQIEQLWSAIEAAVKENGTATLHLLSARPRYIVATITVSDSTDTESVTKLDASVNQLIHQACGHGPQ